MHPRAEADVGEQLDEVEAAHRRAIDEVLALAAAVQPPRDGQLRVVERPVPVGVVEHELDLAGVDGLARRRPREQHVVRLLRAELRGLSDPAAHTIASATFDFPDPFGPTTTATPGSSLSSSGSTNDLKPRIRIVRRCTRREASWRRGRGPGPRRLRLERPQPTRPPAAARPRARRAPPSRPPARQPSSSALAPAELLAVDDGRTRETAIVRRPLGLEDVVAHRPALAGERLLELGLVVDEGGQRVRDPAREGGDHRRLDLLEAVREEERTERGLEESGEDVAVPRQPLQPRPRGRPSPVSQKAVAEPELAGDDGAALRETTCERIFASRPSEKSGCSS